MNLINKEDAIEIISKSCDRALKVYDKAFHSPIRTMTINATRDVRELTPIESRPTGKWVQSDQDKLLSKIKCSVCNRAIYLSEYYNYCPHCGAEMENE